jgi:Zn-dependent protease
MLSFRLLGIPVGVHLTFLFVALLGATAYRGWDIAWWTAAAFVSILLHEMGHALTARAFDATNISVTLYALGGLTSYGHRSRMTHWQSFVVSAAGSATGLAVGGVVWYLARNGVFDGAARPLVVFIDSFVWTALVWGGLNWIPVVPLDGGHMLQSLAAMVNEKRAPLISQAVTWIAVVVIVPLAWTSGFQIGAILLVVFALAGLREYRDTTEARKASERMARGEQAPVRPDEIRPAPPADPTPRRDPPGSSLQPPRDPPEFPI